MNSYYKEKNYEVKMFKMINLNSNCLLMGAEKCLK